MSISPLLAKKNDLLKYVKQLKFNIEGLEFEINYYLYFNFKNIWNVVKQIPNITTFSNRISLLQRRLFIWHKLLQ